MSRSKNNKTDLEADLKNLSKTNSASKNQSGEPVHLHEDEETGNRFLIYSSENGPHIEIRFTEERLWMTQAQISTLFEVDISSVSRHIRNIFDDGELDEETSLQKLQRSTGRPAVIYNIDVVISVGYRVSSKPATIFRKWATEKLVQFATKGWVVDAERLKSPHTNNHFQELREIIRDIRASEANLYKEVRQICSLCKD